MIKFKYLLHKYEGIDISVWCAYRSLSNPIDGIAVLLDFFMLCYCCLQLTFVIEVKAKKKVSDFYRLFNVPEPNENDDAHVAVSQRQYVFLAKMQN